MQKLTKEQISFILKSRSAMVIADKYVKCFEVAARDEEK